MIWKRYRCGGVIVDQLITTQLGRRDIGVHAGCVCRQSARKAVMSQSALSSTFNPVMFIFTSDVRSCSARSPSSHKLVTVVLFSSLIIINLTFHYVNMVVGNLWLFVFMGIYQIMSHFEEFFVAINAKNNIITQKFL